MTQDWHPAFRGLNLPHQQVGKLLPGDLVTWEATYRDGRVLREREGHVYAQIDRTLLVRFGLVQHGELLIEVWPEQGGNGANLVYRRRTTTIMFEGRTAVNFLVGFVPCGPLLFVNTELSTYRTAPGFILGDPDFAPVPSRPHEGELWSELLADDLRVAG